MKLTKYWKSICLPKLCFHWYKGTSSVLYSKDKVSIIFFVQFSYNVSWILNYVILKRKIQCNLFIAKYTREQRYTEFPHHQSLDVHCLINFNEFVHFEKTKDFYSFVFKAHKTYKMCKVVNAKLMLTLVGSDKVICRPTSHYSYQMKLLQHFQET